METQGYTYVDRGEVKLSEPTVKRVKVINGFMIGPGKPARAGDVVALPTHFADQQINIGNAEPYVARTEATAIESRDPVAHKRDPEILRRSNKR